MNAIPILVLSLLFGDACVSAGQPAEEPPTTIRLDVNLVVISVNVLNKAGAAVSGLGKDAFKLFVDDAPAAISLFRGEDAPVTVGIVVDNSASMGYEQLGGTLLDQAKSKAKDSLVIFSFF